MSFSFLLGDAVLDTRQVARVRNHTGDTGDGTTDGGTEGRDYFLSDERILGFLDDEAENAATEKLIAKLAAAAALDMLATNEAYVQKVQTTLGESTDGAATAKAIRDHANSLRRQVADAQASPAPLGTPDGAFNYTLHRV